LSVPVPLLPMSMLLRLAHVPLNTLTVPTQGDCAKLGNLA